MLQLTSSRYLHERGIAENFKELLGSAQSMCEALSDDTKLILSDIFYARGADAAETNQKEIALANNLSFLRIREDISKASEEGATDLTLAQAYNQAGNAYLDQGNMDEAIKLYEKAMNVFRSRDDYTEVMTTICVANLGTALWMQADYEKAFNLLVDNLLARQKAYGLDDTTSFRWLHRNY
jgi:tetratricopeptide (TPR) repeat protein